MSIRLYSLDNLRAVMMLLGPVLHAASPYMTIPYLPDDQVGSHHVFDLLVLFIHTIRMPTFFLLAGFFTALLIEQRGLRLFVANRIRRILVPFLIGYFTLNLLVRAAYVYVVSELSVDAVNDFFQSGLFLLPVAAPTAHLWFLYFLLIFYGIVYIILRLKPAWLAAIPRLSQWLTSSWALPGWVLLSGVFLWSMPGAFFYTANDLTPRPVVLGGYFIYFLFGWLTSYAYRAIFGGLARRAWHYVGGGLLIFAVYALLFRETLYDESVPTTYRVDMVLGAAASCWLLMLGIVGLFNRYGNWQHPTWQYIAQASYWVYLVHFPICLWLQIALLNKPLPAVLKFGLVLSITLLASFFTYHIGVRNTVIGHWLNGQRVRQAA